jgi:hypothetical protein
MSNLQLDGIRFRYNKAKNNVCNAKPDLLQLLNTAVTHLSDNLKELLPKSS